MVKESIYCTVRQALPTYEAPGHLNGSTKQWVCIWVLSCSTGQVLSANSYTSFVSLSLGFTASQGITFKWWLPLEHAVLQSWLFEMLHLRKIFLK